MFLSLPYIHCRNIEFTNHGKKIRPMFIQITYSMITI
nr:MAG TPA: hypothetical protein [Bacteriophage sp.]